MVRNRKLDRAREHMVSSQLAARGITDERVLAAMRAVPRHEFVATHLRHRAYDDAALPAAHGQTISQPWIVAYMTQELLLGEDDHVLEVGAGTGYGAAVLARIARDVTAIERDPDLAAEARRRLAELGVDNVTVVEGDGSRGWPGEAPFDAISVTAAAPDVPGPLVEQLAAGGRLLLPVRSPGTGHERLVRVTMTDDGPVHEDLRPVRFVPLKGEHGY